jgi:hypothetical protein
MSSPSNLYAEKIFAEHPSALWPLDDIADYISLIDEDDRNVAAWDVTGGIASLVTNIIDEPFISSHVIKLSGSVPSGDTGQIECISNPIINFTSLNSYMSTITVGAYVYSYSSYISSFEIGYEYDDTASGSVVQVLRKFDTSIVDKWLFLSGTFEIPEDNTSLRLLLKVNYVKESLTPGDYDFLVNGFTLGQWCEEFNANSLGSSKTTLPTNIALDSSEVIVAKAYGLEESNGYYFINDNALMAKNSGVPMVFGASNVTILSPNENNPSLIVPGKGMFNDTGKFKEYTLEMWMRINSDTATYRRIVGPIGSEDGIYVNGPFITLRIGKYHGSHYVGEWSRPMLIQVRYITSGATLLINGDQVIDIDFDINNITFPDKLNSENKDQDWIGFYSYEDVSPIEIDCIAIYPYQVPSIVAKRRWIYGQGVELPENINTAYSGTSVFVDYAFADYTNNYTYPDLGRWDQALIDNLYTDGKSLSVPNYQLPTIYIPTKTIDQLYTDCNSIQTETNNFITFKPNTSWNNIEGYLLFDTIDILNSSTEAFYGVFKETDISKDQTLFYLEDVVNGNYLEIRNKGTKIEYVLKYTNEDEDIFYENTRPSLNSQFIAGINIKELTKTFGGNVSSFFGRRGYLKLYVGNNKDLDSVFVGNIYKVGFCSERNLSKMQNTFDADGIANQSISQTLSHTASYTLIAKQYFGDLKLDISAQGYWEDNIPLSYFAQYITDASGKQYYDLDFMQFNIDYPAPSTYVEQETTGSWLYSDLLEAYRNPVQRNYDSLDNSLFTGYENYQDLAERSVKSYNYDTSSSLIKSYVTFQYTQTGANADESYFSTLEPAPKNGIVLPQSGWINTKYEIVDNMIIYPPQGSSFKDLSAVFSIDFVIEGLIHNKVKVRNLQIASQAFNEASPNMIGTRFGSTMYPYVKSGIYYDYKAMNPYTIYKGSTPYLYLNRNSGIQLRGSYDPLIDRGIAIPINPSQSDNYKVIAMQAALRYDEDFFPYAPTEIFSVESNDSLIKFYMVATHPSGKRAKIYAINATTGQREDGIGFYWNGKIVKEPVITIKEWGFIGVNFAKRLDFSNRTGEIKINGPVLMNSISHYQSTNLQEVIQQTLRPWFKVKFDPPYTLDWLYWDASYIWGDVLVLASTSYYGIDPGIIYKSYTGTNKIIVDDTRPFSVNTYEYKIYQDVSWQSQTISAV